MGLQAVLCILFSCVIVAVATGVSVPSGWESMCTLTTDMEALKFYLERITLTAPVTNMQCFVTGVDRLAWRFQTLRDWLRDTRDVSVFLQVRCGNGGQISLPWPMKARGLIGLIVSNCILTDKYGDFGNSEISQIPDYLRVLDIRNSVWLSDGSGFDKITSPDGLANLTSDYDCGQDSTIEYLVTNNVSDAFTSEQRGIAPSVNEVRLGQLWGLHFLGEGGDSISESWNMHPKNLFEEIERPEIELDSSDQEGSISLLASLIGSSQLHRSDGNIRTPTEFTGYGHLGSNNANIPLLSELADPRQFNNNGDNIPTLARLTDYGQLNSNEGKTPSLTRLTAYGQLNSNEGKTPTLTRLTGYGQVNSNEGNKHILTGLVNPRHLNNNQGNIPSLTDLIGPDQLGNNRGNIPTATDLIVSGQVNSNASVDMDKVKAAEDEYMKLLLSLQSLDLTCHYENLRVFDESSPHILPVHHFSLLVKGARYPELRVMNYSRAGMRTLPQELSNFRFYFPKLEYLDLSRNYLTEIRVTSPTREADGGFLTLDVRNNLITNISVEDLVSWSQNTDVFVDIRDNPIVCSCLIKRLLDKIQSETFFVGILRKYSYIRDLKCARPLQLRGQKLSNVRLRCDTTTNFAVASESLETLQILSNRPGISIGIVVVVFAMVSICIVVIKMSRKESLKICRNADVVRSPPRKDTETGLINLEDSTTKF